jgi:hypothetical protein
MDDKFNDFFLDAVQEMLAGYDVKYKIDPRTGKIEILDDDLEFIIFLQEQVDALKTYWGAYVG